MADDDRCRTLLKGSELKHARKLEEDLRRHMADRKPQRHAHSLSVASTAERLARAYGVDPFAAYAAGILHDWDKVLSAVEQRDKAARLGIDLGVAPELVTPLLHGMTAARDLRDRYGWLPDEVWPAIERHTIGAVDMSDLDMVIFVADGIEPLRRPNPDIDKVRAAAWRKEPLSELYWESFSGGVGYVIATERYLYPGTLEIYNELVQRRDREA